MSARRSRRALLFCPGSDARKIEKAAGLGADAVIVDLEDAVARARKAEARATTAAALARVSFGRSERVVRINPVDSGLESDDLDALDGPHAPDAVLLPKAESGAQVRAVSARLAAIERSQGLSPGRIRLLALIETARGIVRLAEIAAADPRLDALAFGAEDLCGDLGATRTRSGHEVATARSLVVVHAAAERLQAIDTPFVDLKDREGLQADTRTALELGYTGRFAIHPAQVEPIQATFTPDAGALAAAQRLLEAFAASESAGHGVFELDGRMVDMPMVRAAERLVQRARSAGTSG